MLEDENTSSDASESSDDDGRPGVEFHATAKTPVDRAKFIIAVAGVPIAVLGLAWLLMSFVNRDTVAPLEPTSSFCDEGEYLASFDRADLPDTATKLIVTVDFRSGFTSEQVTETIELSSDLTQPIAVEASSEIETGNCSIETTWE